MGEHSRSQIPRKRMPIAFGMITEPLDAADSAYMKSHLPAPVRLLLRLPHPAALDEVRRDAPDPASEGATPHREAPMSACPPP